MIESLLLAYTERTVFSWCLVTTAWRYLGCGWMSPDVDGICKYIEYAVVDNQQELVLQLRGWAGANNSQP